MEELISGEKYVGIVEDASDAAYEGKVRLRVSPYMDAITKTSDLPIAHQTVTGAGAFRVPRVGDAYYVRFGVGIDGKPDIERPIMEGPVQMSNENVNEHATDYQPGTVNLAYDHAAGLRIGYSPNTGIIDYLKGSSFSIQNDGTINFTHAGNTSAFSMQDDDIDFVSKNDITLNGQNDVNLEGGVVNVTGSDGVNIKGDTPGECAVNGNALKEILVEFAKLIDSKYPMSPGIAESFLNSKIPALLNEHIKYV